MTQYRQYLSVPPDDVDAVHDFLHDIWAENPHIPSYDQMSFETAIIELVANIILYSVAVSGVTCEVTIEALEDEIRARISDNGELTELELEAHIMPDAFSESGRGIALIKALVDDFTFDPSGNKNEWRMSKRIQ